MSGLNKITIERNQKTLLELVVKPGNDICADCKARNPRWASHNLGIFICVNCASIHRKIGTHISKVKSLTMDSWTKEQVESMKTIGNIKSNAIFNPNEIRHPPPPNLMDSERDSELEQYIRSKYEYKRFLDKSALVASKLGPSRSASSVTSSGSSRSVSTPLTKMSTTTTQAPTSTASRQIQPQQRPSVSSNPPISQPRSVSQPVTIPQQSQPQTTSAPQESGANPTGGVWADLVSLQAPTSNSSLPLQFQQGQYLPQQSTFLGSVGTYQTGMGVGVNPYQQQQTPSNPYTQMQQPYSAALHQTPFSTGVTPSFSPGIPHGQQSYFSMQSQTPLSTPGQTPNQFFHPQPQQGHLQIQVPPQNQTTFASPQATFMSAPAGQAQFLSSSPAHQFPSHSPQPQMQMPSSTPQPQMQMQMQMPMQHGQYMSHSPQTAMGTSMGMMSSTPQGQFPSTTPQPQMQVQPGQFMAGMPQSQMGMSQQQGQFGGYQGQGQAQMFPTGGYTGQQWGAM